jgi:hypothetical protein
MSIAIPGQITISQILMKLNIAFLLLKNCIQGLITTLIPDPIIFAEQQAEADRDKIFICPYMPSMV